MGKQSNWMISSKEQSLILVLNSEIRIGSKSKIKFIGDRFNKDLTSKLDSYYLANSNALYINNNEI